ncbi:resolvase-like protein [Staphylococcus aureus]|nr:resolvase-like protein [Staphylococcus aureus]SAO43350.1 resolvase-like protein [Staphylococcus aureus]SAO50953.1 resolvase-like protein [Staphylococcus aureus]
MYMFKQSKVYIIKLSFPYQRKINIDTLKEFGCGCVYSERISGVKRTELVKCLDYLRESDTLVVYQLDRLGRTTKLLIELSQ